MLHLKMYFINNKAIEPLTLPEGYSFSPYGGEQDIPHWLECCRNGLVEDDADAEIFHEKITHHEDTDPFSCLFFLDYKGEHIGTATAIYHPKENIGELHMVGIRSDFRGKGLVKYINNRAILMLTQKNIDYIYLKTNEWRENAVRSYISAGYLPVEYDVGMEERWREVLKNLGIKSIDMVDENGRFFKKLCNE